MKKLYKPILAACFLTALAAFPCNAEIAVIGNKALDTTYFSKGNFKENKARLARVWLGKVRRIPPSGKSPQVSDQSKDSVTRDVFYKSVIKKTDTQLNVYWAKKSFILKGVPPEVLLSDEAVLRWVASHDRGLGYVDASAVNDSVNVLLKISQ